MANRERVRANKAYYRQRQAIVEHPFGTIKRQWGYSYTLLQRKRKVAGEFALIFLSYNFKRAMNTIGITTFIKRLKQLKSDFWRPWRFRNYYSEGEILGGCGSWWSVRLAG